MKNRLQIVISTLIVSLFVGGIAAADETGWASEAQGNGMRTCPSGTVATSLHCAGDYCAMIDSECSYNSDVTSNVKTTDSYSEENGDHGKFYCEWDYVVTGFDVSGYDGFGDNIQLQCTKLSLSQSQNPSAPNYILDYDAKYCDWTPWISEEVDADPVNNPLPTWPTNNPYRLWSTAQGYTNIVECEDIEYPVSSGNFYQSFVHGMQCDGAYCDNMRLYCCAYPF